MKLKWATSCVYYNLVLEIVLSQSTYWALLLAIIIIYSYNANPMQNSECELRIEVIHSCNTTHWTQRDNDVRLMLTTQSADGGDAITIIIIKAQQLLI